MKAYDQQRGTPQQRGYGIQHRKWRALILARDIFCQECMKHGTHRQATEADHVIPIVQGGSRFDENNGQGLCKSCHSAKTSREGRGGRESL